MRVRIFIERLKIALSGDLSKKRLERLPLDVLATLARYRKPVDFMLSVDCDLSGCNKAFSVSYDPHAEKAIETRMSPVAIDSGDCTIDEDCDDPVDDVTDLAE